jgi:hypothetical protein
MFTSKGIILMCGFKEHNNIKPHKNGRKEKEKTLRHGSG